MAVLAIDCVYVLRRSKDDIMAEIRQLQSEMAQYEEGYGNGTKES
jgi:hypothetical protein